MQRAIRSHSTAIPETMRSPLHAFRLPHITDLAERKLKENWLYMVFTPVKDGLGYICGLCRYGFPYPLARDLADRGRP
jgi:hypothetical protein